MVRRPKTINRYKSRLTIPTIKHSVGVMVWGCYSGNVGTGGLYFLPRNVMMNSE